MKAVIQRVSHSKLKVDKSLFSEIGSGLMILLGITHDDNIEDLVWLAKKVAHLRIFDDEDGVIEAILIDENENGIFEEQLLAHLQFYQDALKQ